MGIFMSKHATEALDQGLGNGTAFTALLTTLNNGCKGLSLGYGVALTGASAMDLIRAKNTGARCLFVAGCVCGAAGTVSTSLSVFNNTVGLPAFGLASNAVGEAFFLLGVRANRLARIVDIPGV
jgi:hypothetical protein